MISDLLIRTQDNPLRVTDTLRAQVRVLDKDLEITNIRTLASILDEMLAPRRFTTLLLGLFTQIALILAAVGLYGLLQYTVTRSTREIGIRIALGATGAMITQSFLYRSLRLILSGMSIGLLGSYAVSRAITSLLFQSKPMDLGLLAITVSILFVVSFLACYLPIRRAARIDPMAALRYE